MCDLCFQLHKTLAEIGEMDLEELSLLAAWVKEYDPERRIEERFAMVAAAMFQSHGIDVTVADMLGETEVEGSGEAVNEAQMERQLMGWCVAVGGEVIRGPEKVRT